MKKFTIAAAFAVLSAPAFADGHAATVGDAAAGEHGEQRQPDGEDDVDAEDRQQAKADRPEKGRNRTQLFTVCIQRVLSQVHLEVAHQMAEDE